MAIRSVTSTINVTTDANGEFAFTVQLPLEFPYLVTSSLLPSYQFGVFASPLPSVIERATSPIVDSPDYWSGVVLAHFVGRSDTVSGTADVRYMLVVSDTYVRRDGMTTGAGTITQP